MNTSPFLVNALINDTIMVQALIDNGCLCSGIIDDALSSRLNLSLDLDGFFMEKLWLYIVPSSTHKMILGKKWLEDQDAVIHSKDQKLELKKHKIAIFSVRRWRQDLRKVARPKYASAELLASMAKTVPICKVTFGKRMDSSQ